MSAATTLEVADTPRAAAKSRNGAALPAGEASIAPIALVAGDAPRKRGRPASEDPRVRLARLEQELVAARAAVREAEQRRWTVVGQAVIAEAESNPELRATLREVLSRRVTAPAAKADIAQLLLPASGLS